MTALAAPANVERPVTTTPSLGATARGWLNSLWQTDAPLTFTGVFFAAVLLPSLAGLWLDDRIITGAPAWLKPSKFAASIAVYALTLAWVFAYLPNWTRMRRAVSRTTTVVMFIEMAIIAMQAWRGTTSHFNVSTPLDGVLFGIMGAAIVTQTVSSIAVAYALWRERFSDAALGWALRIGMTLTILGAFTGGLMTRPTSQQLEQAQATGVMSTAGAHTVGAADGGRGLPGTGWSTEHGDLRVPHFIGLHAVQALPLFAFAIRRRPRSQDDRADVRSAATTAHVRWTLVASIAYAAIFALALVRALMGLPLL